MNNLRPKQGLGEKVSVGVKETHRQSYIDPYTYINKHPHKHENMHRLRACKRCICVINFLLVEHRYIEHMEKSKDTSDWAKQYSTSLAEINWLLIGGSLRRGFCRLVEREKPPSGQDMASVIRDTVGQ